MKSIFAIVMVLFAKTAITEQISFNSSNQTIYQDITEQLSFNSSNQTTDQDLSLAIKQSTCKSPLMLYTELVIPNEGLLDYKVFNKLDEKNTYTKSYDWKYNPNFSNVVYEFRLLRSMNLKLKMNISSNALVITNANCTGVLYFLWNDYSNDILIRNLQPGYYKLIAVGFYFNSDRLFELNVDFAADYDFKYASGSCKKPIPLNTNISFSSQTINFGGKFEKVSYQTKLRCSNAKSPSVVYSFEIPEKTEFYFQMDLSGIFENEILDTVLAITNSTCHTIDEFCNDDSVEIGGLSSFLSGVLTRGKYNVVVSCYENDTFGSYYLRISYDSFKLGNFEPIKLNKSIILEKNGSFDLNDFSISICHYNGYYSDKTKSNRFTILQLQIQDGKKFNGTIELKAADGRNKMNTFIRIREKKLHSIFDKCNDDSKLIGGLSSRLDVELTSGEYILMIGALGKRNIGDFHLKLNFRLIPSINVLF